ncbi:BtrH N-terminal domain-containing protein [Paenibacillus plantarum]|nr:BtrH N-terminal domain-containing protein [Paenibacillus plantarum]
MNYTIGLSTSNNLYTFDYTNCFEKPLGLILSNEEEMFQSYFLTYLKMFQSYRFSSLDSHSIFYTVDFNDALSYIIKEKLGFEVVIQDEEVEDVHRVIKQLLSEGHPVMVPGNLHELNYSEHYQTNDWKHLFLINGYNEVKQAYSVIDSNHKKNITTLRYEEFTFSFPLIEQLYLSAKEKLNVSSIWSIYRLEDKDYPKDRDLLLDILEWFIDRRYKGTYKELEYIERINKQIIDGIIEEELDITKQIDFIFLRAVKYKDTFYTEFLKLLDNNLVDTESVQKLHQLKKDLINKWTDIANKALIRHYLKETVTLDVEIQQVLKQEAEILRIICLIRDEVQTIK